MASGTPRVCVVIGRTRHKMVQVEVSEAAKQGAELVELRLDFLAKAPDLKRLLAAKPCALVATVRRNSEGGRWAGKEEERKMLLRQCIVSGFDWVDLETDVADDIRRFKQVKRIVSYHNFAEVPGNLDDVYARICEQDADVIKIAVMAQSPADNLRVIGLLKRATRPTVAFCLGDMGVHSRLLGPKYGAPFVYAAFNKERGIAPGMPSFDEVRRVYHVERIGPATKVFGVVGDPIGHSHSPLVHNVAYRQAGIDAVCVPFRVPRGQFPGFLKAFEALPVDGYSVTIPHKEAAATSAHAADPTVEQTHAANTLALRKNGYFATNTDYPAFLDSLKSNLPHRPGVAADDMHKRPVLILGAGGMARAAAHALAHAGATIWIANRTFDRAEKLAREVHGEPLHWEARYKEGCEIIINCTPVGMHPNVDESPVHKSYLRPGVAVFETVYTPETTLLVKEARACGCHVITGVDMFVRQAGLQFELFMGQPPPFDLMAQTLRRAISPVTTTGASDPPRTTDSESA